MEFDARARKDTDGKTTVKTIEHRRMALYFSGARQRCKIADGTATFQ